MTIEERLSDARARRPSVDADEALRLIRSAHRRRQRTRLGAAAVVAAGAVIAALGIGLGSMDDQSTNVATGVSQPDEEPILGLPVGWSEMPASPLSPRVAAAAVATEEELVIWGGRATQPLGDGAAYDFRSDKWRVMSGSPLPPQADAVAVWTDTAAVFWGGIGEGGTTADGVAAAAWNPATNEWRVIPNELGLGASRTLTGAAWTGSEVILVGVSGPANAFLTSDVFAVDPTSGDLRSMEPTPRPSSPEYRPRGRAAFVVGDELLLVTVADGFPVTIDRLDIETGRWAPTVETNMPGLNVSSDAAAWTGARLVIANHLGAGAVFDPADGELQEIPSSDSIHRFPAIAVTPDIVSVGDRYFEVSTGRWNDAEAIPDPIREFPVAVDFAGAMYVWGGDACGPAASCTDIVDPGPGLVWVPPAKHEDPVSTPSSSPIEPPETEPDTLSNREQAEVTDSASNLEVRVEGASLQLSRTHDASGEDAESTCIELTVPASLSEYFEQPGLCVGQGGDPAELEGMSAGLESGHTVVVGLAPRGTEVLTIASSAPIQAAILSAQGDVSRRRMFLAVISATEVPGEVVAETGDGELISSSRIAPTAATGIQKLGQ